MEYIQGSTKNTNEVSKKNGRSDVRYLDSVKGTHIPNYADVDDGNFRHQMDYTSRDDTAPTRKKSTPNA